MVDDHDHTPGRERLGGLAGEFSSAQKFTQTGNLFDVEVVGGGALEDFPLGANDEVELIVAVGLNYSDLTDQIDDGAPGEVAREFAADQAFQQFFVIATDMRRHVPSLSPIGIFRVQRSLAVVDTWGAEFEN
jgi:hypothetical protein